METSLINFVGSLTVRRTLAETTRFLSSIVLQFITFCTRVRYKHLQRHHSFSQWYGGWCCFYLFSSALCMWFYPVSIFDSNYLLCSSCFAVSCAEEWNLIIYINFVIYRYRDYELNLYYYFDIVLTDLSK